MKIIDRKAFLALPEGVVFSKVDGDLVGGMQVKGETRSNDFGTLEICGNFDWGDGGNHHDSLAEMKETGKSVPFDHEAWGRDGMYDDQDMFLIYEADDLRKIKALLDVGIAAVAALS